MATEPRPGHEKKRGPKQSQPPENRRGGGRAPRATPSGRAVFKPPKIVLGNSRASPPSRRGPEPPPSARRPGPRRTRIPKDRTDGGFLQFSASGASTGPQDREKSTQDEVDSSEKRGLGGGSTSPGARVMKKLRRPGTNPRKPHGFAPLSPGARIAPQRAPTRPAVRPHPLRSNEGFSSFSLSGGSNGPRDNEKSTQDEVDSGRKTGPKERVYISGGPRPPKMRPPDPRVARFGMMKGRKAQRLEAQTIRSPARVPPTAPGAEPCCAVEEQPWRRRREHLWTSQARCASGCTGGTSTSRQDTSR